MPKNEYSISQNFLTGRGVLLRLLSRTDLSREDLVLEIGAGKGHITRLLAERCRRVLACEIDPALHARLAGTLPDNVTLRCGDFMRMPLPASPYKVFANIPFNCTSAIIHRLTEEPGGLTHAWLIVEKGAAMRFSGAGRDTLTSLCLQPWWEVRIRDHIRREAFHPSPGVDCVLLELRRKPKPDLPPASRRQWERFLRHAHERGLNTLLTPRQVSQAMRSAGIPPSATLRYVQWLCLFRCWQGLHR